MAVPQPVLAKKNRNVNAPAKVLKGEQPMRILYLALLIMSGLIFDCYSSFTGMTLSQWQEGYSTVRDLQFIGFAMLAFECCPYSRTELKVITYFMVWWRLAVGFINELYAPPEYSIYLIGVMLIIYLSWLLKAAMMDEFKVSDKKPGAYHIFFPIHSNWGLLQAIFLPWHPARYESRMVSDGKYIWCINKKQFKKYPVSELNIVQDHVKVYLGRSLSTDEIMKLDTLEGMQVRPGITDCREFLL